MSEIEVPTQKVSQREQEKGRRKKEHAYDHGQGKSKRYHYDVPQRMIQHSYDHEQNRQTKSCLKKAFSFPYV